MANYIAVVHKDPKSDFGVSFPDFPGCITAGSSIDEAKDIVVQKSVQCGVTEIALTKAYTVARDGLGVLYALPGCPERNRFVADRGRASMVGACNVSSKTPSACVADGLYGCS